MSMRKRRIKFALEMRNGEQVRSLEELQQYFDVERAIGYFQDGKLLKWLNDRFYDDEADAVKRLTGTESDLGEQLCRIFHVEKTADSKEYESPEAIAWRNERLEKLKQYTADPEILRQVDFVAFDQDDLEEIIHEEDTDVVYLCQNKFTFPSGILRKRNMKYIGIGKNVEVAIKSKTFVDFEELGILFENVSFDEDYTKLKKGAVEKPVQKKMDNPVQAGNKMSYGTEYLSELIFRLYKKDNPSLPPWGEQEPEFLFNQTLHLNTYPILSRILDPMETVICIKANAIAPLIAITDQALYEVYVNYGQWFRVHYQNVRNVYALDKDTIVIDMEAASSRTFPCKFLGNRAMRDFLLEAMRKIPSPHH